MGIPFEENIPRENDKGKKPKFEYSPENPPPLEILESKVFAVHATSILPESGTSKAGAVYIFSDDEWEGQEPPAFRPTIHFSLGELVREHSHGNWEKKPYAILSPLKNLEGQLVNVLPHDTFILGDLKLQPGMILLIPKGTDTSKLPQNIEVREYEPEMGLRQAIDSVIEEKAGWHIQMKPEGASEGSVAYIEDVEINNPKFFQLLFEKCPHISFGTHIYSEKGDAFRFGTIEKALDEVMQNYSSHWFRYSTVEVSFRRSLIVHHLGMLEQALEKSAINPEAFSAFEEKKTKLTDWLNIIDCDLEIRQKLGKTFTGAPEKIQKKVRAVRNDPVKLRKLVDDIYSSLPNAVQESELQPMDLAQRLAGMSPLELEQFKAENEEIFKHVNLPEFHSNYAVIRWIIINSEQAQNEGLDQLLISSLEKSSPKSVEEVKEEELFFEHLKDFLDEDSNRLGVALTILNIPAVKKRLEEALNMHFEVDGPKNLHDVIVAYPETKILFESQEVALPDEQKTAYQSLDALGLIYRFGADRYKITNFRDAYFLASDIRFARERLEQDLETVTRPMNTARNLDNMLGGTIKTLYEILRGDESNAEDIWRKVGLEKEFRKKFPTDIEFWDSSQSLLEIYNLLKTEQEENNS